jgi:hypothetical protein
MDMQELADRDEIRRLCVRYSQAVDRRDLELLGTCFTDDAHLFMAGAVDVRGRAEIVERIRNSRRYAATMHFLGNQTVELDGDAGTAETYCVAYHSYPREPGTHVYVMGIRYCDDVIRLDGEWKISSRVLLVDWTQGEPLPLP